MDGLKDTRWTLAAAALIALVGGCERRDPQSRSMVEARNTLTAAGAGGSAAAPKAALQGSYAKVLSTIKDDAGSRESVKAINAAFVGGALAGQGELAAGEFREADADLLHAIVSAKAQLSLYTEQRGLADALSGYDPQVDIAGFDGVLKERESELAAAKRALADNESKVGAIRTQSKSKADAARSMMESLGGLRSQLLEASSADRPALAQRVNTERRKAEGIMRESEILDAEAAKIAPVSVELELTVQRIEQQIASLNGAKEQARSLAQSRSQSAAEAARGAEQTAGELKSSVDAVRKVLAEHVKPAYEGALGKLNQSSGKYGQARGGPDQTLLTLSNGMAAQAVGALHREYAESLGRVASLLAAAGSAKPAISGASEISAAAESVAAESKQALESAFQQYEKAKASFKSGSGSAELRESVDLLAAKVNESWVRLGGKPPEEEKAPEPAPESDAAPATQEEPAAAPAEGEAPPPTEESPAETPEHPAEGSPPG